MEAAKKTTTGGNKDGKHVAAKMVTKVADVKTGQGTHTAEVAGADGKSKSLASLMYPSMNPGPGAR